MIQPTEYKMGYTISYSIIGQDCYNEVRYMLLARKAPSITWTEFKRILLAIKTDKSKEALGL